MDRDVEDRIVAMLERVAAVLPRNQLYARFDDDFESEEDLARVLGRLVANGRLLREKRATPAGDEFVYRAPNGSRVDAIAAAAVKVASSPQPAAPTPEVKPMAKSPAPDRFEQIVEFLKREGKWFTPAEVADGLGVARPAIGERLRTLATEKRVQAVGNRRGLRYAAVGVVQASATVASAEKKKPAPDPKAKARRKAAARTHKALNEKRRPGYSAIYDEIAANNPRMPLRDVAAKAKEAWHQRRETPRATPDAPLPVMPAPQPGAITWAITDKGHVAINDGKSTIRLSPEDIAYGVSFLERSQLLWMNAA